MFLAIQNRHDRDEHISFEPDKHIYKVSRNGKVEIVATSVTSFCKSYFKEFNPMQVINKNYDKWKLDVNSKYYHMIHAELQISGSDACAKQTIAQYWQRMGDDASKAGTKMHERAERICNGMHIDTEDKETSMIRRWLSGFQREKEWTPYRTEWRVWFDEESDEESLEGQVLVAGALDLLLKSASTGEFALVDFKRTNPNPKYAGGPLNLLGPCENPRFHPGYAASPLSCVEDSKYGTYCMQLNVLSKILRDRYDIDVGNNMYLLQVHCDLEDAHCVQVDSLREQTNTLFAIEAERRRV